MSRSGSVEQDRLCAFAGEDVLFAVLRPCGAMAANM